MGKTAVAPLKVNMTIVDLINMAREKAKLSPLSEDEQGPDRAFYDIYLEDLLDERDWIFTINKSTNLVLTKPEIDLDYAYAYIVGNTDVQDVLSINNEHRSKNGLYFRDSLRFGYVTDPVVEETLERSNFVYTNGILYSTVPVTQIFYKRKPATVDMPPAFRLLLVLTLAEHMATSPHKDREIKSDLKRQRKDQHLRAIRHEMRRPTNPVLAEIYDFIQHYRTLTGARYGG